MKSTEPTTVGERQEIRRRLRNFGMIMCAGLTTVGGLSQWLGRPWGTWVMGAGGLFLFVGLTFPLMLRPVEIVWLFFGEIMSWVMTRVILTATFFLVITPIGWIVRLTGTDNFGRRPDKSRDTYWIPVQQGGPASRPDKPF